MTTPALAALSKVAFIGGGNMAAALISGLARSGFEPARIAAADPNAETRAQLTAQYGIATSADNAAAVAGADVVVLAVKPQLLRGIALEIAPRLAAAPPTVLSVAAGIPLSAIQGWLGAAVPVVRTMPNRPALNGCGATGLYAPPGVSAARRAIAEGIMAAVGVAVWVETESLIDTVTALSGSGPAYFFLLMEALEQAAVARGMPGEVARRLAIETAYGSAVMAREGSTPPGILREQVTSRGGTTAAALAVFDAHDLRAIVAAAVQAADERAAALAAEFSAP